MSENYEHIDADKLRAIVEEVNSRNHRLNSILGSLVESAEAGLHSCEVGVLSEEEIKDLQSRGLKINTRGDLWLGLSHIVSWQPKK